MKADTVSVCCVYFLWQSTVFNRLYASEITEPSKHNGISDPNSKEIGFDDESIKGATGSPTTITTTIDPLFLQRQNAAEEQLKLDEGVLQKIESKDVRDEIRRTLFKAYFNAEKLKQEAKQDAEKLIRDAETWKKKFEISDNRLNTVYTFSRLLCCGENLIFAMEMFPNIYETEDVLKHRINSVHTIVDNRWKQKTEALEAAAKSLAKAATGSDKNEQLFSNAFSELKNIQLTESTFADKTDLGNELIELSSLNEADARIRWSNKNDVWKAYSNLELPEGDKHYLHDISKLTLGEAQEIKINKNEEAYLLEKKTELNYLLDYIELGPKKSPGARYNKCAWVMHRDDVTDISETLKLLEENWTDLPKRSDRIHAYCYEYEKLYNAVSKCTHHKPALPAPFPECRPGSSDYETFLEIIGVKSNLRMTLMTRTLYTTVAKTRQLTNEDELKN